MGVSFRPHAACWRVIIAVLALSGATQISARQFEFLYIEASEGSASGGHAAVKFDNDVFHFQHVEPGLLRVYRNDFAAFKFAYGDQENRSIYAHRIEVAEEVFQALHDAFRRRLLIQNRQFSDWKALNDDLRLLMELKQASDELSSPPTIELKGLGYFLDRYRLAKDPTSSEAKSGSDFSPLKRAIVAEYGDDFLPRKRERALAGLLALRPSVAPISLAEDRFAAGKFSFAGRNRDHLLNLAALDILESGSAPRRDALLTGDLAALRLSAKAAAKMRAFREKQFADLIELIDSERGDWGYPFLVGMARLYALDRSIESGRLVVLERAQAAEEGAKTFTVDAENRDAALDFAERLLSEATRRFIDDESLNERGYGDIETAAGILLRVQAAAQTKQSLALPGRGTTPSLSAKAELTPPSMSAGELENYRQGQEARLAAYGDQLQALYSYHLLSRNCATEIFRVVNDTLRRQFGSHSDAAMRSADSIHRVSEELLGGYMDGRGPNGVPFVAFDEVGVRYRVHSSYRLPPYRERQIERRYQSDTDLLVDIAESNSLTSSVYRWYGDDAAFLFFTQDAIWLRPLFGGANLAVAAGQGAFGLLTWPWDEGLNLQKSLKGVAVSVPELMFFNIRKGSFPNLLPDLGNVVDPWQDAEDADRLDASSF